MPAPLTETFGRYRIVKQLGAGGMGAVYLAHDTEMDRAVALKVPQFDNREQQAVIEQFKREARIAARIRHPGICPVYDVGCIDGVHYLTMAYIEGRELADVLASGEPWPPARAIELVIRIAEALHELHMQGIVHRDLKPGNILLQSNNQPVLLDFGLARSVVSQSEQIATRSAGQGTPAYMAPEQWAAQVDQIKPWTDVYALGVILFELLTGNRPFKPASFVELYGQVLHAERPRPSEFVAGITPTVDQLCREMIAIEPRQRPADMPQLITRLKHCQHDPAPQNRADTLMQCPQCGKRVRITEKMARKKVLCPGCRTLIPPASPVKSLEHTTPLEPDFLPEPALAETLPTTHLPRPQTLLQPQRRGVQPALLWVVLLGVFGCGTAGAVLFLSWPEATPTSDRSVQRGPMTTPSGVTAPSQATLRLLPLEEFVLTAGEERDVPITIERAGWNGEVTLVPLDTPSALQVTPAPVAAGESTGKLKVRALKEATSGRHLVRLRALGGDNLRAEQSLTVIVRSPTSPPVATLKLILPSEVTVTAGRMHTVDIVIERSNYTGEVKLFQEGQTEGVQLRLTPIAAGETRVSVQILAEATAKPGKQRVSLLARGATQVDAEGVFTVQVKPVAVLDESITNSIGMQFKLIPKGKFQMGLSKGERALFEQQLKNAGTKPEDLKEYLDREQPQHEVEITQPFYMGVYEVTQEEYEQVMQATPSAFRKGGEFEKEVEGRITKRLPVENVSWLDAVKFCETLNNVAAEKQAQRTYRLPTEAEWEYACRAGSTTLFHYGDKLTHNEANFETLSPFNSPDQKKPLQRPVAVNDPRYKPNAFGLYHMHGNVYEWCSDWFDPGYYATCLKQNIRQDPPGPQKEQNGRVMRSGSWQEPAGGCYAAYRTGINPGATSIDYGFRVVCITAP